MIIPQKDLSSAKSRINLDATARRRLAIAMLADTVAAVLAVVDRLIVVCDNEGDADELRLPGVAVRVHRRGGGLNAAVAYAETQARAWSPGTGVAVIPGDLPGLRPAELAHALGLAARWPRSFVADAAGTGTTFLAATAGHALRAEFGPASRAAHRRSGAVELGHPHELRSLRYDVDDLASLATAITQGCGPRTRSAYGQATALEQLHYG